jgi:LPXTG-motif cell wall-anchored protein
MKKIITIMFGAVIGVLGTSQAFAQDTGTPPVTTAQVATPELCVESDGLTPAEQALCDAIVDDGENPDFYPPSVLPPTTTTTTDPGTTTTLPPSVAPPTTVPPAVLPSTGSSGTSGFLQVGALLLTGGLLIVIAARRRSTVRPSAA